LWEKTEKCKKYTAIKKFTEKVQKHFVLVCPGLSPSLAKGARYARNKGESVLGTPQRGMSDIKDLEPHANTYKADHFLVHLLIATYGT
jgi:hypothetical protein